MTPNEFWESTPDLFFAYEQAYINNLHQRSHIEGMYYNLALEIALKNTFAKKGDKKVEYPKEAIFSPLNESHIKQKQYNSMDNKQKDGVHRNKMSFWNKFANKKKKGGND